MYLDKFKVLKVINAHNILGINKVEENPSMQKYQLKSAV